jgi:hypothetical protein
MNDPLQDINDTLNSSNNSTLLKDSGIFSPPNGSTPIPNRPTAKSRKTLNHIFDESISLPPFLPISHDTPVRLLWTSNSIQESPRLLENKGTFFNSFRILRTCILYLVQKNETDPKVVLGYKIETKDFFYFFIVGNCLGKKVIITRGRWLSYEIIDMENPDFHDETIGKKTEYEIFQ